MDKIPLTLFREKDTPITRNTLITTIPLLPKQYEISFDFKPTKWLGGWTNILHMTTDGNAGWGNRIPGFFPHGGKVAISNGISGNADWRVQSPAMPLNEWVHFKLTQRLEGNQYTYRVYMDHRLLVEEINTKAEDFREVDIWLSDNWYQAQPGFVKNLYISGMLLKKDLVINVLIYWKKWQN